MQDQYTILNTQVNKLVQYINLLKSKKWWLIFIFFYYKMNNSTIIYNITNSTSSGY